MSSDYFFICMSHDPGMLVGREYRLAEVTGDALPEAVAGLRREHPKCDLALARESGAIVEVGCITTAVHGHAVPRWTDMDILRVVLHARPFEPQGPGLAWALGRLFDASRCWPQERIWRLKAVVDLEPAQYFPEAPDA